MDDPGLSERLVPEWLHRIPGERVDTVDAVRGRHLDQAKPGEKGFLANELGVDADQGEIVEPGAYRTGFVDERERCQ
jgi:hypothetical protein